MTTTEARVDLLRGQMQSCYVMECARVLLQRKWGGEFLNDAELTEKRADRLGRLLDEHGFRRPDEVIEPHAFWLETMCGSHPTEVGMGSAILHNFGNWTNEFMGPYLGAGLDEFKALGATYTRVEGRFEMLTPDTAVIDRPDIPDGRRFAILTDVHIGSEGRAELARIAVREINELGVDVVVIPGDITEDGEPDQFRLAKEIFDSLEAPYHVVLGNHDAVQRSTREGTGKRFYRDAFGAQAGDHVVECADLQIALVDSTDPVASPFPDWDLSAGRVGGIAAGTDSGALEPGQAEALAQRLDPSRRTLLVQHHELHPFPGVPPVKFALREEDAAEELAALSRHRLVGVVAGHTHRSAVLPVGDGSVTQLEIPALKDWPHAYSIGVVTDDAVHVVVRQIADRDAVWSFAQHMPAIMRRFATGPLSSLGFAFGA